MNEMTTSETLNRAADLIEERGWGKGPFGMDGSRSGLCVMGALFAAVEGRILTRDECRADETSYSLIAEYPACKAMAVHLDFEKHNTLYFWNDGQRNASEVIEVLRACAVIEASRERETAEVSA